MFGDDLRDIILLHHRVECALRINDHDRAQGAEAEASCLYNSYFLGKSVCINLFMQSVDDPQKKAQDIVAYVDDKTLLDFGAVPKTRKVNNKALSEDINLTAQDVGALTQGGADGRYFQLRGTSQMGESLGAAPYTVEFTEEEDDSFPASSVGYSNEASGLAAENVQAAIDELAQEKAGAPKRIAISIPTTGWTYNKQTFTVTGIPADPTTYEVHLAQVGATNVAAAMACGLYIADEAQNSLTLAVNSVPETAFQVYAVVQGVSV